MKKTLPVVSSWFVFFLVHSLSLCQGAPRRATSTYDQRQDGKYNVHAKLDNFLIVIAPSSSSPSSSGQSSLAAGLLQNDLLSQVFDLKNVAARIAAHNDRRHRDDNGTDDENEEKIETRVSEHEIGVSSSSSNLRSAITGVVEHENNDRGGLEVIAIVEKKLPLDLEKSEQLSDPLVDDTAASIVPDLQIQTTDDDYNASKLKKIGRSLEGLSGVSSVGNNVGESINKPGNVVVAQRDDEQELKLLGGGIENCGPERYRDRYGICRFRVEP